MGSRWHQGRLSETDVRIDFSIDGGLAAFPGLAKPVTIECDALPVAERTALRDLVDRAGLFEQRARASAHAPPDARRYTIAGDDGGRCGRVTVAEPIADPALRDLVATLRTHARAVRAKR